MNRIEVYGRDLALAMRRRIELNQAWDENEARIGQLTELINNSASEHLYGPVTNEYVQVGDRRDTMVLITCPGSECPYYRQDRSHMHLDDGRVVDSSEWAV